MAVPYSTLPTTARLVRSRKVEEDGESLLRELASAGGSGLQYIGETLNKPSRALWGSLNYLAGGKSGGGLLNLVPFSDAAGLTNPRDGIELSGFLENQGVIPKNRSGFDAWDIPRFALDVGGDPTAWGSGLGLLKSTSRGGHILSKVSPQIGKLSRVERMTTKVADVAADLAKSEPDALSHALTRSGYKDLSDFVARHGSEPVGGLASLNHPFGAPLKAVGTGPTAQKIGGALDKLGEAVRYSAPGRVGAALFSRQNRGALTRTGQELAQTATDAEHAAGVTAREAFAPHLRAFDEYAQTLPDAASRLQAHDAFRAAVEGAAPLPQDMQHLQPAVDATRQINADILPREQAEGLLTSQLDDLFADYNRRSRFFFPGDKSKGDFPSILLSGKHGSQKQRQDILRDLQGGTSLINRLSLNPQLSGIAHTLTPAQMTKEFWDQQETIVNAAMQAAGAPNWTYEHSRKLAKWLAELDPRHVSESIPVFPHNPLEEATRRVELGERAIGMAKAIRESVKQNATDFTPGGVPVTDVIERAGLNVDQTLQLMGLDRDAHIPRELADDIGRVVKTFRNPDEVGVVLKALDKFTNLFKTGVTSLAPAFHVRNRGSGIVQNILNGMWSWRDMNDADKIVRGRGAVRGLQELGGAYKGLSDDAATRKFAEEAFAQGVAPRGQGVGMPDFQGTTLDRNLAADIPGVEPLRFRDIASAAVPRNRAQLNPLNTAGVRTETDVFAPAVAGRMAGQYSEAMNRLEAYLSLRRKGFAPKQAADRVRAAHVDYSNLSDTERHVMRRLIPFYSFSKGQADFLVNELLNRPGGSYAQSIRATNELRGDEPVPDYVGQGLAIPLGQLPDGSDRFLTSGGLMHEEPASLLSVRGGVPDLSDTFAEIGSRLHPLIKYPIEAATGESLFQRGPMGGRDILDQDPPLGRLATNIGDLSERLTGSRLGFREELTSGRARPVLNPGFEQFAANMPTSRIATTLRTLTDPRKYEGGLFPGQAALQNALTGTRVSDVSIGARDAMLREEVDALIRQLGGSQFNVTRFTKSQIANATPEERDIMLRLNTLKDELSKRAKIRKKALAVDTAQ